MTIDNPTRATLDTLKRLDKDPPGTWLAQPKYDGWRRWYANGQWHSKHSTGPASRPMPKVLTDAFDGWHKALSDGYEEHGRKQWAGLGIDAEWIGPRHTGQADTLVLFDMICASKFYARYNTLLQMTEDFPLPDNISLAPVTPNSNSRTVHMCLDIAGALKNKIFKGFMTDDGMELSEREAEKQLEKLKAKGVKVMPLGKCDGFDDQTGCPGHYAGLVSLFDWLRYPKNQHDPVEGIVVRRADSLLVGGDNPLWYKVKW